MPAASPIRLVEVAGPADCRCGGRRELEPRVGMFDKPGLDDRTFAPPKGRRATVTAIWCRHGGPGGIELDSGFPPATPLPSKHTGPEALRHCLATVLPKELLETGCQQKPPPVSHRM